MASTRPLYGRGAGSTPAGGSTAYARSSVDRALPCDGSGRWFDSSRAYHFADVAQREEHRSATPGRPVRSGSSAPQARGVRAARRAPTSQVRVRILAGLLARSLVAGRSGSVISWARAALGPCGSTPHSDRTPRPRPPPLLRAGTAPVIDSQSAGRGSESRPARLCSTSSAGGAVPGCATTTAAARTHHRGPERIGYLSPWSSGRPRTSTRHFRRVSTLRPSPSRPR
jgi:hypothetical protein